MSFRTKLDYSDNRQIKQHVETRTILSGGTSFGLTFSALTSGPDPAFSGISLSQTNLVSTFSGNTLQTVYTWYDVNMNLGINALSALTPSNSATTQNTNNIFTASTSTTIDGNFVALAYTGVNFNLSVIAMVDLGGSNYSGSVFTSLFNTLSANTLDYTGRTIWADVSGITRTENLIITSSPIIGYVWTCVDAEGRGYWGPDATGSTTYWSAGTGTNAIVQKYSNGTASGILSVSEGNQTISSGDYSHAEGGFTTGSGSTASGLGSHAEGLETLASGLGSHAEGLSSRASGSYTHSEGWLTTAIGLASHAEGNFSIASGITSHAEGSETQAKGYASHSQGYLTIALGDYSHAEGVATTASGNTSHAEGTSTTALGDYSHSEGSGTLASGNQSHSEGQSTTSSGLAAHAQGWSSKATGSYSHAQGYLTLASGSTSHAEGNTTTAIGNSSHSEGVLTIALADSSHAGGVSSIASGTTSFIHSTNSRVNGARSVVLGGQNITGNTDDYVYVPSLNINVVGSSAFVNDIRIDATGNLTTNTSDIRFKENISTLTGALDKIKQLRGVNYQWIDKIAGGDSIKLGFIAQEVDLVDSNLVFTNKVDGYKGIHIDGIIPLLVEAIKELSSGITSISNVSLNTQTILAEDNNIELNFNGNNETSIGGGITVLHALGNGLHSEFKTDINGNWVTNNDLKPKALTIPIYTPTSSNDIYGSFGNITCDDSYIYIKTSIWKRIKLEEF